MISNYIEMNNNSHSYETENKNYLILNYLIRIKQIIKTI